MIRRFLTRVLIVVLLAYCGYNWWQAHQLQAEVVTLRLQIAALKHHTVSDTTPTDWIRLAQKHADNAHSALNRSDWFAAQRELSAGMDDLRITTLEQKAGTEQKIAGARLQVEALHANMGRLQHQADSLWRRVRPAPEGRSE